MSDHMQAAIEESAKILAAIILAKGWDSSNEQTREAFRTDSTTMLEAALPHLRAMIAQEILKRLPETGPHINMTQYRGGIYAGVISAARIAKGERP